MLEVWFWLGGVNYIVNVCMNKKNGIILAFLLLFIITLNTTFASVYTDRTAQNDRINYRVALYNMQKILKELNVKILELQREFLHKYGRDISLEEISKELKISKEEIAMALDSARPVDSIEDAKYKDNKTDKTVSILEQISTGKDEETEITNRITIKNLINELNDKEKEIILLRYYKQKTQMQVSKILGITQVQVSRIERKVLDKMKKRLSG